MDWIANLILPGAGLILLRKEWLGLMVSLLFATFGNVAIAGGLIAPDSLPAWLTWLAGIMTAATWVVAQGLLVRQRTEISAAVRHAQSLANEARAAISRNDMNAARVMITEGLSSDASNPTLQALREQIAQKPEQDPPTR